MRNRGVYDNNPFILTSEHKRVLASTQERYDILLRDRERTGFWRGVGTTMWACGAVAFAASLAGFVYGLSFVQ